MTEEYKVTTTNVSNLNSDDNLFNPPKYAEGSLFGYTTSTAHMMGYFKDCAIKSGWTDDEIDVVINACKGYSHRGIIDILDTHLRETIH